MTLTLMATSFTTAVVTAAVIVVAIPMAEILPGPCHLCLKPQQLAVKNFEPTIALTLLIAFTSFALP